MKICVEVTLKESPNLEMPQSFYVDIKLDDDRDKCITLESVTHGEIDDECIMCVKVINFLFSDYCIICVQHWN